MAKLYRQTGSVTDAGKETSSRNATTHGGASEKRHIVEHISPVSVWRATVAEEQELATPHALLGPDHFVS